MLSHRLRWALAIVPVVLLVLGVVSPVAATAPTRGPVPLEAFTIPLGLTGCSSFDVRVEPLTNKEKLTTFFDQAGITMRFAIITGALKVRFTNLSTGRSVDQNISGPIKLVFQPDGSLRVITVGPAFYWFFDVGVAPGQPRLALFHGKTVSEFDAQGNFHFLDAKGNVEDVCALLANA